MRKKEGYSGKHLSFLLVPVALYVEGLDQRCWTIAL